MYLRVAMFVSVLLSAVFLAVALPLFHRRAYLGFWRLKFGHPLRRLLVNNVLFVLGLAYWATAYGLVSSQRETCNVSLVHPYT